MHKIYQNYNTMLTHLDSAQIPLQSSFEVLVDVDYKIIKEFLRIDEPETEIFFYHKDHLGSSTQITDMGQHVIHHIEYMPTGEQFLEQRDYWHTPYRFNGKELDEETGLYYYGARYYTPEIGIWLSVDPLAGKYPSLSPYNYCSNNPVMLVDPDGKEPRLYVETKGFGHVFVTAGTGDNTVVYTYGRYGELGKDKSSVRGTTLTGEGVLIRLTGNEAKSYIQDQITKNEAVAFEFTKGSDEAVMKHFDNMFNSSEKMPTSGDYADNENARVIDTYNLFNNNCVTVSIDGVQSGSKEDLKLGGLKGPMAIRDVLNVQSGRKESNVIKIAPEQIKKELKLFNE